MKIWCQLPMRMPREDQQFRPYYDLLEKHYNLVKRKDTEITIKDVDSFDNPEWLHYSGLRLFNDVEVLKSLLAAERNGFDGISIACFFDPALHEARQLLKIPVTGLAESSLHLACMMGDKFAIIVSQERHIPAMEEHITRYGVESKAIGRNPVRTLTLPEKEVIGSTGGECNSLVVDFKKIAIGCLEDGAEVLVVGCGLVSPVLMQAGITEINGAAIIDPLSISLKLTEALVDLHKAKIPVVSRRLAYSNISHDKLEQALASLNRSN